MEEAQALSQSSDPDIEDRETAPADLPRDGSISEGMKIGPFVVERELGRGTTAVVLAAYDPALDRRVAVKLLHARMGVSAERDARFLRESRALAKLRHPNVVTVHQAGSFGEHGFIAMELVEGETLGAWLVRTRPGPPAILAAFLLAGKGLAAAHGAGLIHRDFKPENVLRDRDGRVQVTDFGLVGAEPGTTSTGDSGNLTGTGDVLGTPRYMSPEQHLGRPTDARADQFSFAVALYEALYGSPPFRGGDLDDLRANVLAGRLLLRARPRGVPRRIERALWRALSIEPAARWPSMDALLDAIAAAARPRTRTRLLVAAAAIAAAGTAATVARWPEALPTCGASRDRLAGVWDGTRKAVMHAAFATSKLPYAERQWQTVERTLDGYAAAWAVRSDQVCARGAAVPRTEAERRSACLAVRLDHLRMWVNVFTTASADLVRGAAQAVAGLDQLAMCDHPDDATEPTPNDPLLAAQVKPLREQLVAAKVRAAAGEYQPAVVALRQILAQARVLGYQPLVAETLVGIANAQNNADDFQAALASWLELRDLAEETHQDRHRAMGWSGMAYAYSNLFQYDKAHDAARVASVILRPMAGSEAEHARIALMSHEASAYWGEGKLDRALELYRDVEQRLRVLLGPDDYQLGANELNLGGVLSELGRYDDADASYRKALARYLAAHGDAHPAVSRIVNNQGNVWFRKGDYARALERYREALAIKDRAGLPADNLGRSYTQLNIAEALVQLGRADEAIPSLTRAREIMSARLGENNEYFTEALTWTGLAELGRGRAGDAVPPLERALAFRRRPGAKPADLAEVEISLARALWQARPAERQRARMLAGAARDRFVAVHADRERAEAEAWLASHRN